MSTNKLKILIVEDEPSILNGLVDLFTFHGFEVDSCDDGKEGLDQALSLQYDCLILDVMLPSLDGFSICNEVRKRSKDQAIVMLTAKSSEKDIIEGLTLGADDYIAKPFSVHELVLRVKNILKRTKKEASNEMLEINEEITIDSDNLIGEVRGKSIEFTRREVDLLKCLKNHTRPVKRSELLQIVWGYKNISLLDTRTVDIHIAKLRKKIEINPKSPQLILTYRGEGYKLDC